MSTACLANAARGTVRTLPARGLAPLRASAQEEREAGTAEYEPKNAKDAIERGTSIFEQGGDTAEALRLLQVGLSMRPNEDEARAAEYNLACVYTKLGDYDKAAACVQRAVNDHNLRLVVALRDKDLVKLRETQPWLAALREMKGSVSQDQQVKLRAEAKSPFRIVRTYVFGGFLAAAGLSTLITIPAFILALQGKAGTDLVATTGNLAVDLGGVALFIYLLKRDADAKEKQIKVIAREEGLSALTVKLAQGKVVPMAALRGVARPVVLVGNQTYLDRCLKAVEPFYQDMRARGVSIIPILASSAKSVDPEDRIMALRKEFEAEDSSKAKDAGFGKATPSAPKSTPSKTVGANDAKWRIEAADTAAWMEWVGGAKEAASVESDSVYIQVQMDGSIRASGTGIPPWAQFVGDIPELDSIRTRMTDGVGPNMQ